MPEKKRTSFGLKVGTTSASHVYGVNSLVQKALSLFGFNLLNGVQQTLNSVFDDYIWAMFSLEGFFIHG
nr:MAG: hypothetical protein AM325_15865 [Candidatus Thorarchaeota archaeon SMTZ1-45]